MVLRGDFDAPSLQVLDRLVAAPMAEFEFEGFSAEGLAENLVPQANPKQREAAVHEVPGRLHGVIERRGIAGAVGKKHARRLEAQRFRSGSSGRDDLHLKAMLAQPAQ